MSLVGTLARVAVAVGAAKGIGNVIGRVGQPAATGGMDVQSGNGKSGGGLGTVLEQLGAAPGIGDSGSKAKSSTAGGLDTLIKGFADAVPAAATKGATTAQREGSFAEVLNQSFQNFGEPKIAPTPQQDAVAGLMLRAMLQAAKCDGRIDEGEKTRLIEVLGQASREDVAFVNRELSSPVDVQALIKQVPRGLESQIYAVSLMSINLDSQKEAEYLAALASGLGIGAREANAIHAKLHIPALFT
jgi:uncharacterized membrane protein YebE (DUF533 family)